MPAIRQLINRETGFISAFGQYLSIEDYKKLKQIMNEYLESLESFNQEETK
jgi:hypothetical protein